MRVDPNYISNLTNSLDQSTSLEDSLTNELSSGLRVTSLGDNPTAVGQSTLLGSSIAQDDAFVSAESGVQSMLQVSDSTLSEVVTQLTSAVSTAVSGNDGSLDSSNLQSIAQELNGIRSQVLSLANTSYQGQYLFSGSQGSTTPFTLDTSTDPATATYNGDTSLQYMETPSGQSLQTNVPGSAVFSQAFIALNQLISDYSSGTASTATLTADTSALSASITQVSSQRSTLDASLNRLESTSSYVQTEASELTVAQSSIVSSDPATVATQLSAAETQHQALLSVINTLGSGEDLFDMMR